MEYDRLNSDAKRMVDRIVDDIVARKNIDQRGPGPIEPPREPREKDSNKWLELHNLPVLA